MSSLDNFTKVKVLVVGDVMIDKYLWGDVTRISPEAPVPVVNLKETSFRVGGAANVAANIAGLGATAYLVGVTGNDLEGEIFSEVLKKAGVSAHYIVRSKQRVTTTKTRIIAHNQQIARIDQETSQELNAEEERDVWNKIEKITSDAFVIVISDYAKGVLSQRLTARLIKLGKDDGKIIIVDPKGRDYSKYKDATVITPNKFEIADACGCRANELSEIIEAGEKLIRDLNLKAVIVTRGEEGVTLVEKEKESLTQKAVGRTVFDVTGAGDTFIAALSVSLGAGETLSKATEIANMGAGLAVEELGTTIISFKSLQRAFKEHYEERGSLEA